MWKNSQDQFSQQIHDTDEVFLKKAIRVIKNIQSYHIEKILNQKNVWTIQFFEEIQQIETYLINFDEEILEIIMINRFHLGYTGKKYIPNAFVHANGSLLANFRIKPVLIGLALCFLFNMNVFEFSFQLLLIHLLKMMKQSLYSSLKHIIILILNLFFILKWRFHFNVTWSFLLPLKRNFHINKTLV
jgi:hypothetical protein